MNLLIVDDEYYSVEGIRKKLEASELPLDQIFRAYSLAEAQKVFLENRVDILLSDIEMPKGSGLDLLCWVRKEGYQTVGIFLTSYATFDYASRALKLQSADYLLKPVGREELFAAVQKAVQQVREMEQKELQKLHAEYWNDSRAQNAEFFWQNLSLGKIPPSPVMILHELSTLHLPAETAAVSWRPVLLDCRDTRESAAWEEKLYEYAVKNILIEVLFTPDEIPILPAVGRKQYLILLYPRAGTPPGERTRELQAALRNCVSALPGVFHFFQGGICSADNIFMVCSHLQELAKNAISEESMVVGAGPARQSASLVPVAPWEEWNELLLSQKSGQVEQEALQYLASLRQCPQTTRKDLLAFHHDFLQLVYSFLEKAGSYAHDLFRDRETEALSEKACDSFDKMRAWVAHVVGASNACISAAAGSSDVIRTVKQYIEEHLAEDLNRNTLAAAVFLSPDYLSHLFAEKEKLPLTNYISLRRIHRAKEMLYQGNLSIRDVAIKSGFQNISYFSKQFKRHTGMTPQEFRKHEIN